ncbi:MAG: PAS domain S-box protein [Desulfobacterales bacterium]|nr:MAG: PAS domain S-box protein [Desulfobacterales bacterium]
MTSSFGCSHGNAAERQITGTPTPEDFCIYQEMLAHLEDVVFGHDAQGRFTYVSPALENLLGYSGDEIRNLDFQTVVSPEFLPEALTRTERQSKGEPIPQPWDLQVLNRQGERIWIQIRTRPVYDQQGRLVTVYGVARDIQQKKDLEEMLHKHTEKLESLVAQRTQKLAESEARYRALVDHALTGIVILTDQEIRFANRTFQEITGYAATELSRLGFGDIVHPEDRPRVRAQILGKTLASPPDQYDETRLIRKDGETIWVEVRATAIEDQGQPALLANVANITAKKKAEQARRESEARFRELAELLPETIYEMDLAGRLTFVNANAFSQFGYTKQDFAQGLNGFDMLIHEDRPRARENARRLIRAEETGLNEYTALRKDGTRFAAMLRSSVIIREGQPVGLRGFIIDITERQKAEKALGESEEKYKELVENSSSMILRLDAQGRITFFNEYAQKFFGYSAEEIIGRNCVGTIVPEKDTAGHNLTAMIHDILAHPDNYSTHENENMRRNGERVWVAWTNRPFRNSRGEILEILCIGNDITKRKHLERQLRRAQKMEAIGTLAGGIAHDFNNILSAVMGYTELSLLDVQPGAEIEDNLNEILKASERAKALVGHILEFSRQTEQQRMPLSVTPIVKESLKLLRASLPTTIEIRSHIDADINLIEADPTQILQLMMNLCTNAAHAMRETGGILDVSCTNVAVAADTFLATNLLKAGNYLKLTVRDTGHGMTREVLEKIFDPYFTTKEKEVGTGLGLAVIHGIVESHGGIITAESRSGEGSRFDVYLPAIDGEAVPDSAKTPGLPGGRERILFVDDEQTLVEIGKRMLERLGYAVTALGSSVEALELFRNQPGRFDMVITDMTMPNMTGEDLATKLLAIRPDIPIILCTGYSERITEDKALQMGIKGFVMKPVVLNEIAHKIRAILDPI